MPEQNNCLSNDQHKWISVLWSAAVYCPKCGTTLADEITLENGSENGEEKNLDKDLKLSYDKLDI
jgi:hypothetical protein